jgi:DNA-3-methyladenine glycosylase
MASALPVGFFARPCLTVARELVGLHLVHQGEGGERAGRIVEVEAYLGEEDQASHARFGPTPRSRIMYGPPGRAYVYLIYGMYDCFNVVTEPRGRAAAVLIRALEPGPEITARTDGPGRLCRALGITRAHNGAPLTRGRLRIADRGGPMPPVVATPRIGVDYAGKWAARPYRFVDANSAHLSRQL